MRGFCEFKLSRDCVVAKAKEVFLGSALPNNADLIGYFSEGASRASST